MLIGKANLNDAAAIASVHVLSWQCAYRGLIPQKFLDNLSVEVKTQEWTKYITSGIEVWVVEEGNQIIGFASICPCRDNDMDAKVVAEISAIYFLPEFWRQGLGQQLAKVIFKEVKQRHYEEGITWVLEKNLLARKFYEKLGFVATNNTKTNHGASNKYARHRS